MRLFNSASYTFPAVLSVALHAGLFTLLVWGWEAAPTDKKIVVPKYIDAKVVELKAKAPKVAPPKPEPKVIDVAKQQADQERRQQEAEAKRKAEQAAIKKEQDKRKEEERIKKEKAAVAEKKRQEELALAEQQKRIQEQIEQELEQEDQMLQAEENEATAQSYQALISNRIKQNWSRPPSARNGMKCRLLIQLVPTVRITGVTVTESSGNAAFDRSAEQAAWKTEQFPELKGMDSVVFEQYFRQLDVLFEPQDLRL